MTRRWIAEPAMISKHVPMRSVAKSDIAELVRYITSSQGKQERVDHIALTNCQSLTPADAVIELLNTQACNTRSAADKTYHLLVSFADNERPSLAQLRIIESRLCDALGYGEHQRVSAVHTDTDHLHIHIAINKIHPEKHTIHSPIRDYKTRSETCKVLERELGLTQVDHDGRRTRQQARATDMEYHAGVESLMSWVKRECAPTLAAATNWQAVHQALQAHGLKIEPRGNGLIITTEAGLQVKASSVDRSLARARLEERLGAFAPAGSAGQRLPKPARTYEPRPIGYTQEAQALFSRYQAERTSGKRVTTAALQSARSERDSALASCQRRSTLRRAAIKLLSPDQRRLLNKLATQSAQRERAAIQQTYQRARARVTNSNSRRTWADWLRYQADQGDPQALKALRTRNMRNPSTMPRPPTRPNVGAVGKQPSPAGRGVLRPLLRLVSLQLDIPAARPKSNVAAVGKKPPPASQGRLRPLGQLVSIKMQPTSARQKPLGFLTRLVNKDSTTKHGTIIFRAGATAVRDDGKQLQVSRGASDEGLRAALELAKDRYGRSLKITGSDAFKESVIRVAVKNKIDVSFGDPAMEQRRQILSNPPPGEAHEQRKQDGRGTAASSTGRDRADVGQRDGESRAAAAGQRGAASTPRDGKPNVAAVGTEPPPESKNRLRGLHQLGVVSLSDRTAVLLPSDVPRDMEHQDPELADGMRRPLSQSGSVVTPATAAVNGVDKYIAERESKRDRGLDIPIHRRYTGKDAGDFTFAGVREVDGQAMALVQRDQTVLVLPVTATQLPRLKRRSIGEPIVVSAEGAIKTKGRTKGRST